MKRTLISFILLLCTLHSSYANIPPIYHEDFLPNPSEMSLKSELKQFPAFLAEMYHDLKDTVVSFISALVNIPSTIFSQLVNDHLHSNDVAQLRESSTDQICDKERNFLHLRERVIAQPIANLVGESVDVNQLKKTPHISLCFSGGGFRAMLLTLGFLHGAQEIGLLDATTYVSGLSGSTWAIAPWITSQKDIASYVNSVPDKLQTGIIPITDAWALRHVIEMFVEKIAYKQVISTIDIYGALLANTLLSEFGTDRFEIGFSKAHEHFNEHYPLPIYTTIVGNTYPYEWIEVTPFEIGGSCLCGYIPPWGYGRKFDNGTSIDKAPEQTLGYYLGIFGSAFQVNIDDIIRNTGLNLQNNFSFLPSVLQTPFSNAIQAIMNSPLSDVRLLPSILKNFTYQYPNSPLANLKNLHLVDAGIDFNLPIPPLMRSDRQSDIIIIYDASASFGTDSELKKAADYCKRKGIPFPDTDFSQLRNHAMNVLWDKHNESAPIIIYFPMIKNDNYNAGFDPETCTECGYCSTTNFNYSKSEIEQLCGLSYHTIKDHSEQLKTVLREIIESPRYHA